MDMEKRRQEVAEMYSVMSTEQLRAEFPVIHQVFGGQRRYLRVPHIALQIDVLKKECEKRGLRV